MDRRTFSRFAAALALGALLAAPTLAAPSPDRAPGSAPLELVTAWWQGLANDLVRLVDASRHTVDPNGSTTQESGDDFTAGGKSRHTIDPDG